MSGIYDQNIILKISSIVGLLYCSLCSLVCMGLTTRRQVNNLILRMCREKNGHQDGKF